MSNVIVKLGHKRHASLSGSKRVLKNRFNILVFIDLRGHNFEAIPRTALEFPNYKKYDYDSWHCSNYNTNSNLKSRNPTLQFNLIQTCLSRVLFHILVITVLYHNALPWRIFPYFGRKAIATGIVASQRNRSGYRRPARPLRQDNTATRIVGICFWRTQFHT